MTVKKKRKAAAGDIATNRQASFRFELLEKMECGIELTGTEVKSLREQGAQLKDGYVAVDNGELWLHSIHIAPYQQATHGNHDPERPRKLLAHRKEIERLTGKIQERGFTLIPTRMYFSHSRAKVEIALGRGRDHLDKRRAIKEREAKREMDRALRNSHR